MTAEAAVSSIDAMVPLSALTRPDLLVLGPLLVGAAGWSQIDQTTITDWQTFKAAVSKVFGLTADQLEEKFFAMTPDGSETMS